MNKKVVLATGIVLSLILSSCGSGSGSEAAGEVDTSARLTVAYPPQPPTLDPVATTSKNAAEIAFGFYESLLVRDADGEVQPGLAEDWEVSDDNLVYTFYLREDKVFHDGQPMTADDVVASMTRWSEHSLPGQAYFEGATWSVEDDHTAVLELQEPTFGVIQALSSGREQFAAIMPAEIAESAGSEPVEEFIGTGPFEFVEWSVDQHIRLDRFEDYQPLDGDDARAGDRTPSIEGVDFEFISDASTQLAGLQTGEYHLARDLSFGAAEQVSGDENIDLIPQEAGAPSVLFNKREGIFSDVEARQAVHMGLDPEEILSAVAGSDDYYTLTHEMLPEAQVGWESQVGEEQYNQADPEGAAEMLEDLGYAGETVRLIASSEQAVNYEAAVVVHSQLQDMGLDAELESYDQASYSSVRDEPESYELAVQSFTTKDDPTLLIYLSSSFAGWTDSPELEQIISDFRSSETLDEATDQYDALQGWSYDYLPVSKVGDLDRAQGVAGNVEVDELDGMWLWWTAEIYEN